VTINLLHCYYYKKVFKTNN